MADELKVIAKRGDLVNVAFQEIGIVPMEILTEDAWLVAESYDMMPGTSVQLWAARAGMPDRSGMPVRIYREVITKLPKHFVKQGRTLEEINDVAWWPRTRQDMAVKWFEAIARQVMREKARLRMYLVHSYMICPVCHNDPLQRGHCNNCNYEGYVSTAPWGERIKTNE